MSKFLPSSPWCLPRYLCLGSYDRAAPQHRRPISQSRHTTSNVGKYLNIDNINKSCAHNTNNKKTRMANDEHDAQLLNIQPALLLQARL